MSVVVALSLLHFIWQGALIGATAWLLMKLARTANARYYIGVAALVLMAAAPVVTGYAGRPDLESRRSVDNANAAPVEYVGRPGLEGRRPTDDSNAAPVEYVGRPALEGRLSFALTKIYSVRVSPFAANLLLASWLLGVALLSVRLSMGWLMARRLTRTFVREPRLEILSNAERLMAALNITGAVTVLESALVQVPTAMGWLKPVVLLPAQAMTGLSIAQIDALVAHELAHIKRHDYLVNLLQSAIETLLFYHPAVWLVSRRVRHERELCCDDVAIAVCGEDRVTYASALADLESMRQVPEPMLAANGGSLLTRVKRILAPDDVQTVRGRGHWMAGVAILLTALIGLASQRVQGRQVVSGIVDGVVQGVTGGIVGGVKGDVTAGVIGGVKGGVEGGAASGVAGGVSDGIVGGVAEGDSSAEQKIAVGQRIRLEVMVSGASTKLTARQADMLIASAYTDWNRAKGDAERAKAEADRLKLYASSSDGVVMSTATLPAVTADAFVVNYMNQLEELDKSKKRLTAENGYGTVHPRIVAIDADIASVNRQIRLRVQSMVDAARTKHEDASATEQRLRLAYEALTQGANTTAPSRSMDISKDYTVQEDGTILVPYAGKVNAAGLTVAALQMAVRAALRAKQVMATSVLVSIEGRAPSALPGEINPGVRPVNLGPSLFEMLATAPPIGPATQMRPYRSGQSEQPVVPPVPTNAPPKQVPGYVIGPNDVLHVTVYSGGVSQADFRQMEYTVQKDGTVALPLLYNQVKVGALSITDADAVIRKALLDGKIFDDCQVDITVMGYHSSSIKVQGAVRNPGNIAMTADRLNLSDALNKANGLLPSAGRQIRVKRASGQSAATVGHMFEGWEVYSRDDLDNGQLADVQLLDNDTIDVPVAPKFFVQGSVGMPGEHQWEPNLTLERALLKVGGVKPEGAANRIQITRYDPKARVNKPVPIDLKSMMTFIIEPNDVIMVPKKRM